MAAIRPSLLSPKRMYIPLEPPEVEILRHDEDAQEIYIDALSSIQDLLCRFVDGYPRPRVFDPYELLLSFDETMEQGRQAAENRPDLQPITETMNENLKRAKVLFEDATGGSVYSTDHLRKEILQFLDTSLDEYVRITER